MNSIIRNLIVAVPLATAALMAAPGVAHADGNDVIVMAPNGGDPKPFDIAVPAPEPTQPDGPGELSNGAPKPTHPKPNHPTGPGDITSPTPGPDQPHDGPGDLTDNPHCTHGCGEDVPDDKSGPNPQDEGCFEGCDLPETPEVDPPSADRDFTTPTRVDAGLADAATEDSGEHTLSFVLLGGALVTATGAAYAARARTRRA